MIQKKTLNSIKELLDYLKRNIGVNLLYHYVQKFIMLRGHIMKIIYIYIYSSKAIQKDNNNINKERFEKVLTDTYYKDVCTNRGFRMVDNYMITYTQQKKGLSYVYDKRQVLSDGVSSAPLPI